MLARVDARRVGGCWSADIVDINNDVVPVRGEVAPLEAADGYADAASAPRVDVGRTGVTASRAFDCHSLQTVTARGSRDFPVT